jgi:hypothetical protein
MLDVAVSIFDQSSDVPNFMLRRCQHHGGGRKSDSTAAIAKAETLPAG